MNVFPDFIIAGSAKSGTTALHRMLDQHPAVFMSAIKETNYFVHAYEATRHLVAHDGRLMYADQEESDITDSLEKYRQLFDGAGEKQLLGESSPWYLLNPRVPERIRSHNPDTKLIFILRNPSDVAFANFLHQVRDRSESLGLAQIERMLDPGHYDTQDAHPFCFHLSLPKYAQHLPAYLDRFAPQAVHLMIYEEFVQDRRKALGDLFAFLGISNEVDIDVDTRVNVSGVPKSARLQTLIQGSMAAKKLLRLFVPTKSRRNLRAALEAANTRKAPSLDPRVREKLDALFSEDVRYVERLVGRPLTVWNDRRLC
jgi:hypothetical protein